MIEIKHVGGLTFVKLPRYRVGCSFWIPREIRDALTQFHNGLAIGTLASLMVCVQLFH